MELLAFFVVFVVCAKAGQAMPNHYSSMMPPPLWLFLLVLLLLLLSSTMPRKGGKCVAYTYLPRTVVAKTFSRRPPCVNLTNGPAATATATTSSRRQQAPCKRKRRALLGTPVTAPSANRVAGWMDDRLKLEPCSKRSERTQTKKPSRCPLLDS